MDISAPWTLLRPEEFDFGSPTKGDRSRGIMRLSELLQHSRANIWRMPPGSRGRRHKETTQEEIFVSIEGTATLLLGEPPTAATLPAGAIAIVRPETPIQLANSSDREVIVLVVGAPATVSDAEYLPDAALRATACADSAL